MRAPRALLSGVLSLFLALCFVALTPAMPAKGQLGAVRADKDGWWNRSKGGGLPITSPALPFPVPANGLAIAASTGEPEKAAAVGIVLDADPVRFQRLLLNVGEVADNGANVAVQGAVIKACPIKVPWTGAKDASWPPPSLPAASELANCAAGARSSEGIWSFDLTTFARQWLAGTLAQNGVLLVEDVSAPVSFQVVVGDRTTAKLTFAVDILSEEEAAAAGDGSSFSDDSSDFSDTGDTGSEDTFSPEVTTFEYSAADSFTVPVEQPAASVTPPVQPAPAPTPRTGTGTLANQRTPSLAGGLPLALVFLFPIGLGVAFLLARALGPAGEPAVTTLTREGAVSRTLARRDDFQEGSR